MFVETHLTIRDESEHIAAASGSLPQISEIIARESS